MIINWHDYQDKDHVIAWLVVEAIAGSKVWKKLEKDFDPSKMDVKMNINGIEVPIIGPLLDLQGQLERIEIEGKAKGIEDAINMVVDVLDERKEDLIDHIRERLLE